MTSENMTDGDVKNHSFWESWLMEAPSKSYTIYVHAKDPSKVVTPLFNDSLLDSYSSSFMPLYAKGDGASGGRGGGGMDTRGLIGGRSGNVIALIKEAVREPRNKWFMILNDGCLPMVGFKTFYDRLLNTTDSIFEMHPEKVL